MSNDLTQYQSNIDNALNIVKAYTQGVFLKLGAGTSDAVKQGVVKPGEFYITDKDPAKCITLGRMGNDTDNKRKGFLKCVALIARPHALHLKGNTKVDESFDINDPVFQTIKRRYDTKTENTKETGETFSYGFDQILYIPRDQINLDKIEDPEYRAECEERFKDGCFGIYFFSRTAAQHAPVKRKLKVGTQICIKSVLIETKTFSWWSPQELDVINDITVPSDAINKYLEDNSTKFANPGGGTRIVDNPAEGSGVMER